jgi:DNA ligase-associated metallophosphoesterase
MTGQPVALAGALLTARPSGALWWPEARLLCVADLHLCKSERLARRRGALLPPYETAETLDRLALEIERLSPETVVCLGDSFDDCEAGEALAPENESRLAVLMAGRDWIWVAGNHDPAPLAVGGRHLGEVRSGPLTFRHQAADGGSGEISGHYHPKVRLPLRGAAVSRPCFLHDARRLILPAFGAYTGGLRSDHPAFAALLGPGARAVLTGDPCLALPLAALHAPAGPHRHRSTG